MDFLSIEFLTALVSIIIIDLVLAGDNAIVIGLAARNVDKANQKKVIIWGTVGAVIIRVIATVLVTYLLQIYGLRLIGGLALIYIAYKSAGRRENMKFQLRIKCGQRSARLLSRIR